MTLVRINGTIDITTGMNLPAGGASFQSLAENTQVYASSLA